MNPHQHTPNVTAATFDCWQTPPPTPLRIGGLPEQQPVWPGCQFVSPPLNAGWQHSTPFSRPTREESQYGTPCYRTPVPESHCEDVDAVVKALLDDKLAQLDESVDLLCHSAEKPSAGADSSPVCPRRMSSNRLARLIMSYSEEHREAVSRAASACEHPLERHVLNTPSGQLRVLDELSGGQFRNDRMPGGGVGMPPDLDLNETSILNSSLFENPSFLSQTMEDDNGSEEPRVVADNAGGGTNYIFGADNNALFDRSSIGTPCHQRPGSVAADISAQLPEAPHQAINVTTDAQSNPKQGNSVWSKEFVQSIDTGRSECQGIVQSENEDSDSVIETDDSVISEEDSEKDVVAVGHEPERSTMQQHTSQVDCSGLFKTPKGFEDEANDYCGHEPTIANDDVEMVDIASEEGNMDQGTVDVIQSIATSDVTMGQHMVGHLSKVDQSVAGCHPEVVQNIVGHQSETDGHLVVAQGMHQSEIARHSEVVQDIADYQSETGRHSELVQDIVDHQSETGRHSELVQDIVDDQSEAGRHSELVKDVVDYHSETGRHSELVQDIVDHHSEIDRYSESVQDVHHSQTDRNSEVKDSVGHIADVSQITVSYHPKADQSIHSDVSQGIVGHFSELGQGTASAHMDIGANAATLDQGVSEAHHQMAPVFGASETEICQSSVVVHHGDGTGVVATPADAEKCPADVGMDEPGAVDAVTDDEDMECEDAAEDLFSERLRTAADGGNALEEEAVKEQSAAALSPQETSSAALPETSPPQQPFKSHRRLRRRRRLLRAGKRETTTTATTTTGAAATEKKQRSSSITPWKMRTRSSNTQGDSRPTATAQAVAAAPPAKRGRPSKLAQPARGKRRPVKAAEKTTAKKNPVGRRGRVAAAVPEEAESTRRSKRNKPPKRASKAVSNAEETVAPITQSQQPKAGRGRPAKTATAPVRTSKRNLRSSAAKEDNAAKK